MTVIRIQEQSAGESPTNAVLRFEHGVEYPLQIRDPFANHPQQEADLEWYFEEYLMFPFTQDVRAKKAATSIQHYGEALFAQVFADPHALHTYKQARQQGLHTFSIEIAGSSAFQRLHWEALYDPDFETALSLHAAMVRKNLRPQPTASAMRPAPTINVLVVVARPGGSRDVGYRTISRPLLDALEITKLPVDVTLLRPGTYQALTTHLEETTRASGVGHYHLIHFDVHGAVLDHAQLQAGAQANRYLYASRFGRPALDPYPDKKAFLFLEGEQDEQFDPVEATELANVLRHHQIPIVLLNACQSGKLSREMETSLGDRLIQAGGQTVIAMGYSVTVSAAEVVMQALYRALFQEKPLPEALCLARQALAHRKERRVFFNQVIELEDWLLPILYQNQQVQFALQPLTPQVEAAFFEQRATQYRGPQPNYGFVGRDIDILQIEKRLLLKRNLLLICGMGGAGKTTLLHYLASWWQRTDLVQKVFYFGYDERAWNQQQIMQKMARTLLDKYELLTFQSLSSEAQQLRLTQLLKSTRHLLILDNLESVTAAPLALSHPLAKKEQEALRRFLSDLVGGQTLVVLGSRSPEAWLARGTFEENSYDLAGLDREAASQLAERILERHRVSKYRADPDLPKLLKLLDGFPLALEVVLANLARQTPAEVLSALQEGQTDLHVGSSEKRTENILRCVEYSYRNLSPAAQQLLLCLAPFTSTIWREMLDHYAEHLKQQPALADVPFEQWQEVIAETETWGLLKSDPDVPLLLHIQPIMPYFLRQRLNIKENQNRRMVVEMAFYEYYDNLSETLFSFIDSKQAQEQQIGLVLTRYEYENLLTALRFAVRENISVLFIYMVLNAYLNRQQEHQRGQEIDTLLLGALETASWETMTETRKEEWICVLGTIASRQLNLKEYEAARNSYQKTLQMIESTLSDERVQRSLQASTYHQLGIVAQEQRQWEQAESYYQQALQIEIEYNARYEQASIYYHLGIVAQEQRQWEQAESHYQQALQIEIEYNARYEQASIYYHLGMVAQKQRQWEQAESYYQHALQIEIEYNARYEQASTYHYLGMVAQEQRQWEQAESYYQQALQIRIEFKDRYEQAATYHNLGVVAQKQRQWEQAESYYQQALQIKIEYNARYEQAATYYQLGMVAQEQRQWEQAENYYQQALQIEIEYNARYEQASTYHQLGMVAQERRQWEQAEKNHQQALQIRIEFEDRYEQAATYHNLGVVAQKQRQWEQAESYYQQALQIKIEYNARYEQAVTHHNLGMVAQEQRQWEQAKTHFLEALHIFVGFHDANDTENIGVVLISLARLWLARKEIDLIEQVATLLETTPDTIEAIFREITEASPDQPEETDH